MKCFQNNCLSGVFKVAYDNDKSITGREFQESDNSVKIEVVRMTSSRSLADLVLEFTKDIKLKGLKLEDI